MKRHLWLAALLGLAACSQEPRTDLIRTMERRGAGDLRSVTSQSIEQWFARNPQVAFEINRTCRSLRSNAPAKWGDTADGRICAAAARVHAFYCRIRPAGGLTFQFGK
jgi:hypothetical protein